MTKQITEMVKESWQERYHASQIYTLRCKLDDTPGMLGKAITAIGQTQTQIGNISTAGVEDTAKVRDIQVYCSKKEQLEQVVKSIKAVKGLEVLSVVDDVLEMHRRGAIEIKSRIPINTLTDLRMLYTPGVAFVCTKIVEDPSSAWEYTGLCDRVAVVTNGTAVLGLGSIGVVPSLPVMEGKAAIFAEFANISAVPILVDSKDPEKVIETVCAIASSFGAIQLEDISAPTCFEIEKKLQDRLDIPVMHDDQHGTATVLLAALMNALKKTRRNAKDCKVIMLGAGAAGVAITKILLKFGVKDIVVYDSCGAIYRGRTEKMNVHKQQLAEITNKENQKCSLLEGFMGKDIFIGVAQPNAVSKEMIAAMAKDALVFPLSNPVGEITVKEALDAGAAVAADGRTINNALAYPGLFRGALNVKAKDITVDMQLAAARTLAEISPEGSLLPDILDRETHRRVIKAVEQAYKE
ncbi:MAG: NAD-dependent malic enzyme [Planctomycetaceae bacterium]|nr:NAD-dependent malic enzyme [Planctomycetaceae bacterium]